VTIYVPSKKQCVRSIIQEVNPLEADQMVELQEGKHLTFSLGKETYGIPIQHVQQIIGMMDITEIPRMPKFIKGVTNLRGKIIPILDLRLKFGLPPIDYTDRTCIIIVEMQVNGIKKWMGVVVDAVSEVLNIQSSEIEPPPQYGTQTENDFLTGMGKVKGKVILLLEMQKVLNQDDLKLLQQSNLADGTTPKSEGEREES